MNIFSACGENGKLPAPSLVTHTARLIPTTRAEKRLGEGGDDGEGGWWEA